MKKLVLLVALFLSLPASAMDKGKVKMGPISFKSVSNGSGSSVAAVSQADRIQITVGGSKGFNAGTLTIFLPSSAIDTLSKGDKFSVTSTGNDEVNSASIILLGTKSKVNRKTFSVSSTGVSSGNDSIGSGSLTVKGYDSNTKVLKFSLKAKVSPWTFSKNGTNTEKTNNLPVKANVVVTLP